MTADAERLAAIQANVFAVLRAETYDGGFGYLSPDQFSATCNQAADKVIKVVIAPIVAERDALRARIAAIESAARDTIAQWEKTDDDDLTDAQYGERGYALGVLAALAGDQPEAVQS